MEIIKKIKKAEIALTVFDGFLLSVDIQRYGSFNVHGSSIYGLPIGHYIPLNNGGYVVYLKINSCDLSFESNILYNCNAIICKK